MDFQFSFCLFSPSRRLQRLCYIYYFSHDLPWKLATAGSTPDHASVQHDAPHTPHCHASIRCARRFHTHHTHAALPRLHPMGIRHPHAPHTRHIATRYASTTCRHTRTHEHARTYLHHNTSQQHHTRWPAPTATKTRFQVGGAVYNLGISPVCWGHYSGSNSGPQSPAR